MHINAARAIVGGFWGTIGVGGQALLQLAVLMVLARQLTPAEFGLANTAVIVVLFARMLFELGIGQALVQKPDVNDRDLSTAATLTFLLGMVGAGLLLFQSGQLANLLNMPELEVIFPFYCAVFVLRGVSIVPEARLTRSLNFRLLAGLEVLSYAVGYAGAGIALALYGLGVWSLVGAHIAQEAIKSACLWVFSPSLYRPGVDFQATRELLRFGFGQSYAQAAHYAANQGDSLIVAKLLGEHAMGIYGRTYQLVVMPFNLFGRVVDKVLFPVLSRLQNDRVRLTRNFRRGLLVVTTIAFPVSVLLVTMAPELVNVVLGDAWVSVIPPFQIMAAGLFFRMSYKICDSLVKAMGAVYWRALNQTIYAALVVIAAVIAARWGISAVALAAQFALFANFVLMFGLACTASGTSWTGMLRAFLPGLVLGVLTGIATVTATIASRRLQVPDAFSLVLVPFITLLTVVLIIRCGRNWIAEQNDAWLIGSFISVLPAPLRPPLIRLFGPWAVTAK